MTELDLICTDPAKIGIMGTIAFVSIGFGSIILGGFIDSIGRKKVLLATLMVTPVVQLMWLISPSLLTIYLGLFACGFCYAVRASAAYIFATENLLSAGKLQFCVYQFMVDGCLQSTTAFLFWSGLLTWRKMIIMNLCTTLFLIIYLAFRLYESPQYLYSRGRFTELKACMENIAKRNGVYDRPSIDLITVRL